MLAPLHYAVLDHLQIANKWAGIIQRLYLEIHLVFTID